MNTAVNQGVSRPGKQPATVRLARWSATHPWRAIGLWLVFVVMCFTAGTLTGTKQVTEQDMGLGESGRALDMIVEGGFDDPDVEYVLITPRSGTGSEPDALDLDAATAAAGDAAGVLDGNPEVAAIGEPVPAPNGGALLLPVTLRGDPETAYERVDPVLEQVAQVQDEHPDLRVELVGEATVTKDFIHGLEADLAKASMLSVPVTLVVLLIAFGALIAAGVPVLLAMSAVAAGLGLWGVASQLVPDIGSVAHMIVLMGMAVGVDYSLFYLRREREERARGRGHVDAVEIAAATSGRAVIVSGITVIVSMAGLYLASDMVFASLATGSILVVAVAMLGSLTVLPAMLAKLGGRVDRLRVPVLWRLTQARAGTGRLWPALLRPALRRPVLTLLVSAGGLLLLAAPALDMQMRSTSIESFPSTPALQSYLRMTEAFPSTGELHEIVVRAPADRSAEVDAAIVQLTDRVAADPLFADDRPPTVRTATDDAGREITRISVATPYAMGTEEADESLDVLREQLVPETFGAVGGSEYAVGGMVADSLDRAGNSERKLPLVVGFVLLLTFLMMTVAFRSIVVGLTAIVINLLSTLAAFGLLVLVFQHTWAEGLLGFTSSGYIVDWIPLFLFVVLFGLSMDYHVFVVSRIREAATRGMSIRDAVADGITRSAGTVTSAAVVMVSVFGVFAALGLLEMKQMGVGLAAAILLDAVVIRILVLPSIMAMLGRHNWWPSRRLAAPAGVPAPATSAPEAPEAPELATTRG